VASRSSVQLANGRFSSWGLVRLAAMTSLTCSEVYVAGRPSRGASCNPASPWPSKRFSQERTVAWQSRSSRAIAGTCWPWWVSPIMRARSTRRAGSVREWASRWIMSTSSAVMGRRHNAMRHILRQMPHILQ
jgi:hypothetical protein